MEDIGHEVFVYRKKDSPTYHVMRGVKGGRCVEIGAKFRANTLEDTESQARHYAWLNGDNYVGLLDGNGLDNDTTELIAVDMGFC